MIESKKYKCYYKEESRYLESGFDETMYIPWLHYDIIAVWAVSPHPLKGVMLGYGFYGDFTETDKYVKRTSVSTNVTSDSPMEGVKVIILSYSEAVKRAKEINWSKIKIER